MVRVLACLAAALALIACFPPDLGDGMVACGADGACPPRYYCHADRRCWRAPAGDMAETFDFAGVDFANCSRVSCQPGQCGVIADGCGGTIDCGMSCPTGTACGGGGIAHQCGCPTEQYCNGRDCGTMPDGCGGVVACGTSCPSGQICGAGGMANVCGAGTCQKRMCRANKDCGLISDGCAAVLDCGVCPTGKVCDASSHQCV